MMVTVRPAKEEDADTAVDVVRRSIQQLCVADHHEDHDTLARWLANKTPENFRGWISNPDNFCVVSEPNNCISGVGLLHHSGEIRLFYLAPGSQRQGIGRAIHSELEAAAKRWGLIALHLNSTALARPFYEALGYHATGPGAVRYGVLRCFPYEKQLQRSIKFEAHD